jgi:CBS domain-containing protein
MSDPVATEEKEMKAVDVMTPDVVTIWSKASVAEAAKLMLDRGISGLPVVNDEGRLSGMITETDLLRRVEIGTEQHHSARGEQSMSAYDLACEYLKSHGRQVEEIMSRDVVRVFENTPLAEVAALMELKRIKRVPVMSDGKIVGIVSRADLLRALVSQVGSPAIQISDQMIHDHLIAELGRQRWVYPQGLRIEVSNGVVRLWGTLEMRVERQALRAAAESIPGVRGVEDHTSQLPHSGS